MYGLIMGGILVLCYFISRIKVEYRKLLILLNTIVCFIYISWRITTIPISNGLFSFILGLMLFVAELLGVIAFLNFKYLFTKKYSIKKKTLLDFKSNNIPSVDILICTYNEPTHILEKTISASTNLKYPKDKLKIYVCDDGRRESIKELCNKYRINYISRDNNEGAKAGNINNALQHVNSELFLVLDADMIPKKEFLQRTVGYFSNENLSFVQTPQVYYNKDVYQYNLGINIPNEQDFFMRDIQEARAVKGAVLHVGTNAVFRKQCILDIGGFPTCSLTEDMAVGMLLQSKGYDSLLINEELVLGLSATTFSELVKQRDRWCRGNIQVLKHFNPLFMKGLNISQKIAYLDGGLYWFANLQKLIYIFCPIIYLLTNTLIINSSVPKLLNMYFPFILGQILIFKSLSPGNRKLTWAHFYEVVMAPYLSLSIIKEILCLKSKFNVTSKEINNSKKYFQLKIALPHIFIGVLTILAWIISTISLINNNINVQAYIINVFWSIYNFIGTIISIYIAYQKPIFRSTERVYLKDFSEIHGVCERGNKLRAQLIDISDKGIGIKILNDFKAKINDNVELILDITKEPISCNICRINKEFVGLTFNKVSPNQMKFVMNIFTENMKPYYNLNKSQNYIKSK